LAPLLVEEIFEIIKRVNREHGVSILLVEQNARTALSISDAGYIMENGRIVLDGTAKTLLDNPDVQEFYLGMGHAGERKSYRDVKHYRRRKRWLG
jgi:branched-chain amino acid transport system ATP-binding protein